MINRPEFAILVKYQGSANHNSYSTNVEINCIVTICHSEQLYDWIVISCLIFDSLVLCVLLLFHFLSLCISDCLPFSTSDVFNCNHLASPPTTHPLHPPRYPSPFLNLPLPLALHHSTCILSLEFFMCCFVPGLLFLPGGLPVNLPTS